MIVWAYAGGGLLVGFIFAWLIQTIRLGKKLDGLMMEKVKLEKERESDSQKIEWLQMTDEKMKESFKALSSDLLTVNARLFLKQSHEKLNELLELQKRDWSTRKAEFQNMVDPLNKSLSELDQQVQDMEKRREGAYRELWKQVTLMGQSYQELQKTTFSLTQALKSTTVRGRWGEVQLRRIAEMAGMVNYVDFQEQVAMEDGRPDMIIRLPNEGMIPVDAKTPMNAYLEAQQLQDEEQRRRKLDEHARAMRGHMKALSQKAYWSSFSRSPEFVVMVVPYDSGLTAAFERDGKLFEEALENKVLIVSPVSLLALLKVIAYGWLQLQLAENAQQIAEQGKELYSRFVTFSNHLSDLGKRLNSTVHAYNKAAGSMESRVMPSVNRLKEMGAGSGDPEKMPRIENQSREMTKEPDSEA